MVKRYKASEIDQLVRILKNDGTISVPTDTVYGICARINSKIAHDKLVLVKNRPTNKPFPIMCANEEQINSIAIVTEKAEKLIKKFMPGPITLVLNKKATLPSYATNGRDTVAVRMATSKTIKELIIKLGSPIFMTSANQSGEEECTNLDEIERACPLLDGMLEGKVKFSKGSTIVDCTSENIKILREGPISKNMLEKDKMLAGELYDANYNKNLEKEREKAKNLCYEFNNLKPSNREGQIEILKKLLGKTKETFRIEQPFMCDYGYNIEIGENFYSNHNLIILDANKVIFGDNVFIAPNCSFYTAGHPLEVNLRNKGLEYAKPIKIGNNVWIGGNVIVLPGVTIGDNTVIGAGSVVTKDIPSNVVAVGNPCRVTKLLSEN